MNWAPRTPSVVRREAERAVPRHCETYPPCAETSMSGMCAASKHAGRMSITSRLIGRSAAISARADRPHLFPSSSLREAALVGRGKGRRRRGGCLLPPPLLLFRKPMSAAASSASFHSAADVDSIVGDAEVIFLNKVVHHSFPASPAPEESRTSEKGKGKRQ